MELRKLVSEKAVTKRLKGRGSQRGKPSENRAKDVSDLDAIIEHSFNKTKLRNTRNIEAQSWFRVVIHAIEAKETLRKGSEIEEFEERLTKLEELMKNEERQ